MNDSHTQMKCDIPFNKLKNKGIHYSCENVRAFQEMVYHYYHTHPRPLPWRSTRDPYCILVSEIMLQQTQVPRVLKYYSPFIAAFPGFQFLAQAPFSKVMAAWHGLGAPGWRRQHL